jgi:hypothetical protein
MTDDDNHDPTVRVPTDEVQQAYDDLADCFSDATEEAPFPQVPDARTIRALTRFEEFPLRADGVTVTDATVANGQPSHGEMRSDDHVSSLRAVFDLDCRECGHPRAEYQLHRYHNIAGHDSTTCRACGYVHDRRDWG